MGKQGDHRSGERWRAGDDLSHGAGNGHVAAAVGDGRKDVVREFDAARSGEHLEDGKPGRAADASYEFSFGADRFLYVVAGRKDAVRSARDEEHGRGFAEGGEVTLGTAGL